MHGEEQRRETIVEKTKPTERSNQIKELTERSNQTQESIKT